MFIIHQSDLYHIFKKFFFFFFLLYTDEKSTHPLCLSSMMVYYLSALVINEIVKPALIYFVKGLEGYMSNYEEAKKTKSNCIFVL